MAQRNYIDFKLYLTSAPKGKGACQVSLLPTTEVGETITPVAVPAKDAPDEELLSKLAIKEISWSDLAALGKQLANCLLPKGPIRELFINAYRHMRTEDGIRLRLIIAAHALKELPWEYVFLDMLGEKDSLRGFLLFDPRVSLVRHEPLPHPHPVLPPSSKNINDLKMVIAAALPKGQTKLALSKEVKEIEDAVKGAKVKGVRITARPLMDATLDDLNKALPGPNSAYILHFAGHGYKRYRRDEFEPDAGKDEGYLLLLRDKKRKAEAPLPADEFAKLLQRGGVRLANIGACDSGGRSATHPWSGVAGALTARGIPAVIAMQYEVVDDNAIAFSRMFYYALASGLSLDEAVSLGRQAMYDALDLANPVQLEWGVPVLYSRLPTGAIFPERMDRAGTEAEGLQIVVKQVVEEIGKTGKVTGLSIKQLKGGAYEVTQNVDVVKGELTGAKIKKAGRGKVRVNQKIDTVTGDVTGVEM